MPRTTLSSAVSPARWLLSLPIRAKVVAAVAVACVVALVVGTEGVSQTQQAAVDLARMSAALQTVVARSRS